MQNLSSSPGYLIEIYPQFIDFKDDLKDANKTWKTQLTPKISFISAKDKDEKQSKKVKKLWLKS